MAKKGKSRRMKRGGTFLLILPPLLTNLLHHHEKNEIRYVLTFFRKKAFIGRKCKKKSIVQDFSGEKKFRTCVILRRPQKILTLLCKCQNKWETCDLLRKPQLYRLLRYAYCMLKTLKVTQHVFLFTSGTQHCYNYVPQ